MSLKKRGKYYHTEFTAPNGERIRKSTRTANRVEAQEYEDRLKAELWRVIQVGDKPKMTWPDAVVRYLRETNHKARDNEISIFRALDPHLNKLYLHQINNAIIQQIVADRAKKGDANKTINNKIKKLKAVLNMAKDVWKVEVDPPKFKELPTPNSRVRWITRNEADRLIKELPQHLKPVVIFSLETGLRLTNVTDLKWSQIDFQRSVIYVEGDDILKTDKAFTVPLSQKAREVILQQTGKNPKWVFTYAGKQNKSPNGNSFKKALERAGIENFRWHDMRHTWATWHVQNGTPLHILQQLGGWSSISMVQKYAHYSIEHLAEFVEIDTNLTQSQNDSEETPRLKTV